MDWSLHKYFITIIVLIIINIVVIIINYQQTFMRLILKLKEDLPDLDLLYITLLTSWSSIVRNLLVFVDIY